MKCNSISEIRAVNIPDYVDAFNNPRDANGNLRPQPGEKDSKFIEDTGFGMNTFFKDIPVGGSNNVMSQFSTTVDLIEGLRANGANPGKDDKQIYPKRVKPTVNNPVSSRAKIIYDFLFKFTNEEGHGRCENEPGKNIWTTPLVIDDTPGAENLLESYIFNNFRK